MIFVIVHCLLTDGQHGNLLASGFGLNQLENIAVIATCQATVACNDDIGDFLDGTLV